MFQLPESTFQSIEVLRSTISQPALGEILRLIRGPVSDKQVAHAKLRSRPIEPQALAALLRDWRKLHRINRRQAAAKLTAMGFFTTDRTIWVWESARALPNQPLVLLEKLKDIPPKTEPQRQETAQEFGKILRQWRRKRGLNQREALALLGENDDKGKISRWESGKQIPRNRSGLLAKMGDAK